MNKNDLRYLAGFLDGEGSIGVERYNRYGITTNYGIKISVTNTNRSVLDWIQSHYGGYMVASKPKKLNHHVCFQLTLRHRKAYRLIKDVQPYLKLKVELANLAIKIAERCLVGYNHRQGKSPERERADQEDFETMKELIGTYSYRNISNL